MTFKNHIAKYAKHDEHLETLQWKNPKSSTYAIWYVRQYGTLMAFGDCYEAVYQWNASDSRIDLAWMAGLNEDYFVSKCRASQHGYRPYIWDTHKARETMKEYFAEEEEGRPEEAGRFEERGGWRALGEGKFEWEVWASEHGYNVFGAGWYGYTTLAAPGRVLDPSVRLHLQGLKAAFAQLREVND